MKKSMKIAALLLALVMTCAGLFSCGVAAGSGGSSKSTDEVLSTLKTKFALTETTIRTAKTIAERKCRTLEDYLNDYPSLKTTLDSYARQNSSSNMTMTIDIKGNTVIYAVKANVSVSSSDVSRYNSALTSSFASSEANFKSQIQKIESATGISGIKFEVVVTSSNGAELFHQFYDRNGKTTG